LWPTLHAVEAAKHLQSSDCVLQLIDGRVVAATLADGTDQQKHHTSLVLSDQPMALRARVAFSSSSSSSSSSICSTKAAVHHIQARLRLCTHCCRACRNIALTRAHVIAQVYAARTTQFVGRAIACTLSALQALLERQLSETGQGPFT
jgi:hypothetical protein